MVLAAVCAAAACGGPTYDREGGRPPRAGAPVPTAAPPVRAAPVPSGASSAGSAAAPTAVIAAGPATGATAGPATGPPPRPVSPFPPRNFAAPHARTAKPDDGTWRPLTAAAGTPIDAERPLLFTTTVHPDPIKGFVEVAIVAIDPRVELELVAGTQEPENASLTGEKRSGLVAPAHLPGLLLATNGGYKARHGNHGMRVGTDVFLPPKAESCTIARLGNGQVVVGPWATVAPHEATLRWMRQGPACLLEGGRLHPDLAGEYGRKKWGAAEDGKKDIRRSAYALGPGGILYFAIGEWTTADRLAEALAAAGVTDAVQMDINWSFTRFVVYGRDPAGTPAASSPILEKLKFGPREYWQKASERDFFYAHVKR